MSLITFILKKLGPSWLSCCDKVSISGFNMEKSEITLLCRKSLCVCTCARVSFNQGFSCCFFCILQSSACMRRMISNFHLLSNITALVRFRFIHDLIKNLKGFLTHTQNASGAFSTANQYHGLSWKVNWTVIVFLFFFTDSMFFIKTGVGVWVMN